MIKTTWQTLVARIARKRRNVISSVLWVSCAWIAQGVSADDEFEHPPISYSATQSNDPVALLLDEMKSGTATLVADEHGSYVKSLLSVLKVPESSQCLVFSKTSMQIPYIGPKTPRAIYFSDSVYVGVVVGSPIVELVGVDAKLGCVFYTLERDEGSLRLIRDRGQCLSCHATSRTERVPGVFVRSIYSDPSGRPRSGASTYTTDHRSPFAERWGGWYVTGEHGSMRHLGNIFAIDRDDPHRVDSELGANLMQLPASVLSGAHLTEHSDIVALMVLEHQTRLHNLISRAHFETRSATHLDQSMNEVLGRDRDFVSDSTKRRIAAVGDALVFGLLLAGETELSSPIKGSSRYAAEFSARGPTDTKGRSFYQLDLHRRLFRYPCSYLILSPQFDALPAPVAQYIRTEMTSLLNGKKELPSSIRLDQEQRKAIRDMLIELKPNWLALTNHQKTQQDQGDGK